MKFERFVAMRYMLKRKGLFALITTLIGVAGVSVGVAALITTLSVMNGFQSDIKEKIIGAQSHILVFGRMGADVYPEKLKAVETLEGVEGAAGAGAGAWVVSRAAPRAVKALPMAMTTSISRIRPKNTTA